MGKNKSKDKDFNLAYGVWKKNRVRQGFLHVFISVLTTARTTGKCGPEITPYFDTFHVVRLKLTVQK